MQDNLIYIGVCESNIKLHQNLKKSIIFNFKVCFEGGNIACNNSRVYLVINLAYTNPVVWKFLIFIFHYVGKECQK